MDNFNDIKEMYPDIEWKRFKGCSCSYPITIKYFGEKGIKHHPSCFMAMPEINPYTGKPLNAYETTKIQNTPAVLSPAQQGLWN